MNLIAFKIYDFLLLNKDDFFSLIKEKFILYRRVFWKSKKDLQLQRIVNNPLCSWVLWNSRSKLSSCFFQNKKSQKWKSNFFFQLLFEIGSFIFLSFLKFEPTNFLIRFNPTFAKQTWEDQCVKNFSHPVQKLFRFFGQNVVDPLFR